MIFIIFIILAILNEASFEAFFAVVVLPETIKRRLLQGEMIEDLELPFPRFRELQKGLQKALLEGPLANPEYYWGCEHIQKLGNVWGRIRRVLLNRGEVDEWVHVAPLKELRQAACKGRLRAWVERFESIEGEVCFSRFEPGENFLASETWVAVVADGAAEAVWDVDVFSQCCEATGRRIISPIGMEGSERTEAWVIPTKVAITHWVTNDETIYNGMISEGIPCRWLSPKGMDSARLKPRLTMEETWEKECPWWDGRGRPPAAIEELPHSKEELRQLRFHIEASYWEASIDP